MEDALLRWPVGAAGRTFSALSLQDSAGRSAVREQRFTLEEELIPGFGLVQSFLLLTDHYILGRAAFIFTVLINLGGLVAFRYMRLSISRGEPARAPLSGSDSDAVFLRCDVSVFFSPFCSGLPAQACSALQLLSRTDAFFYSLLLFNLCTAVGETAASPFGASPR